MFWVCVLICGKFFLGILVDGYRLCWYRIVKVVLIILLVRKGNRDGEYRWEGVLVRIGDIYIVFINSLLL